MRYILMILTMMTLLACGIINLSHAAAPVCAIGDRTFFMANVANLKPKIFTANAKALKAVLGKLNEARANKGTFLLDADTLVIGLYSQKPGELFVGIVMFKDGCIVPGTVTSLKISDWVTFTSSLGLVYEDFVPETPA
jgi:hypothetical protein